MAQTVVCPHCTGRVGHLRGQSLEDALERHLRVGCPSPMVKPKREPDKRGESLSLPESGPAPALVVKQVRYIPRQTTPKRRKR